MFIGDRDYEETYVRTLASRWARFLIGLLLTLGVSFVPLDRAVSTATAQQPVEDTTDVSEPIPVELSPEERQQIRARIDALQAYRDAIDAATPPESIGMPAPLAFPAQATDPPRMDSGDPNPDRINEPVDLNLLAEPSGIDR